MSTWQRLNSIGLNCKNRFVRVRWKRRCETITGLGRPAAPRWVDVPQGGEGYCYAANGGAIFVGFTTTFKGQIKDPTRYDHVVQFGVPDISFLEVLT